MRSIYIAIPDDAADKPRELARREFRAPCQQAAVLVLAGLRRAVLAISQVNGLILGVRGVLELSTGRRIVQSP